MADTYWTQRIHNVSLGSGRMSKTKEEAILRMIDHRLAGKEIWRLDTAKNSSQQSVYLYLVGEGKFDKKDRFYFGFRAKYPIPDWVQGSYRKIDFEEAKEIVEKYWETRHNA